MLIYMFVEKIKFKRFKGYEDDEFSDTLDWDDQYRVYDIYIKMKIH